MIAKVSILLLCLTITQSLNILPHPQRVNEGFTTIKVRNPCGIKVGFLNDEISSDVMDITKYYLKATFPTINCEFQDFIQHKFLSSSRFLKVKDAISITVKIDNLDQSYTLGVEQEKYLLTISEQGQAYIDTPTYVGYLRALDTLSQLMEKTDDGSIIIRNLPLKIQDQPAFEYRGIMIDTARHYLSINTIKRTIDSMMFNKMNVLHWHITDDESFPLVLRNFQQITNTGSYSSKLVYTADDVKQIIEYAKSKGVQIVPEIDTPGHVWSWGKSQDLQNITLTCGDPAQYGQFDPTLDLTYEVVESVFSDLAELFKDSSVPFVHFGGDEVVISCWDKRPQIKEFMKNNQIADYEELQQYYRNRQKLIWTKNINQTKPIAYWANKEINLQVQPDDIVHWWGTTPELQYIKDKTNKIILSNYDLLYLDTGLNNAFGNHYSTFHTWKDIYQLFDPRPQGLAGTVIGGESCLWGETNSDSTHFMKLYTRTSALADRLWNPEQKDKELLKDFVNRLVAIEDRMVGLEFPVMPATSQYCGLHTDVCFPN